MSQKQDRAERTRTKLDEIRAAERRKIRNRNVTIAVVVALVAVVGGMFAINALGSGDDQPTAKKQGGNPGATAPYVRPDSHRLGPAGNGKVTFVEFLDFECEGCRAAYPIVEQLREQYQGKVTFVARYYPLDGHFNGERAARAVEAAAKQGKFEDMYKKMFETQAQWGEQQVPADQTFRGFAGDLGLDVARWDKDYAAAATLARINRDVADGDKLKLQGTPSFFVNGEPLQPRTADDFKEAIDAALAG